MRKISYCQAINEALHGEMQRDENVFIYGIGMPDHTRMFGSLDGLVEKFPDRVIDTPVCEAALTGMGLGAAIGGLRPIQCHIRVDFALLGVNQLINNIAPYIYSTAGKWKVPLVIRMVVGRGWGQGWQHSKSLHSLFAHIPGLKVVLPVTPRHAKGLLTTAIRDNSPVVVIEHRWLYFAEDDVPEGEYVEEIGPDCLLRDGDDLTIVATSWMCVEALHAARLLEKYHRKHAAVIAVPTANPWELCEAVHSARSTGLCIVADNDWLYCDYSAELAAHISYWTHGKLQRPIERVGWNDSPCPTARQLENGFYENASTILACAEELLNCNRADLSGEDFYSHTNKFKGPF